MHGTFHDNIVDEGLTTNAQQYLETLTSCDAGGMLTEMYRRILWWMVELLELEAFVRMSGPSLLILKSKVGVPEYRY